MKSFNFIDTEKKDSVSYIILNRPEQRNALNGIVIEELISVYKDLADDTETEFVVIKGNGKAFCAGADLDWMKNAADADYDENIKGSRKLAGLFNTIYTFPKVTIAQVHGAVFGGAIGLMAANDFVIASEDSKFAFSEVKLGLIPATIAPYIVRRTGQYKALELMITGRLFYADEAENIGLLNQKVKVPAEAVKELLNLLKLTAPKARTSCKTLLQNISGEAIDQGLIEYTVEEIAKRRVSEEGQEGMKAFFQKRKPDWIKE